MALPTPSNAANSELPAAQTLATVEKVHGANLVRLPPRFARAAVLKLLELHHILGDVIEGPRDARVVGRELGPDEWAIRLTPDVGAPLRLVGPSFLYGRERVFVFAKCVVILAPGDAARLLRALEAVKPDELDASGRPCPWVPVRHTIEALGRSADDDDAILVSGPHALPKAPTAADEQGTPLDRAVITRWLEALATTAELPLPELTLTRATSNRLGFTSGRVWFERDGKPLRVHLTVCPNADPAEIMATLAHELAHPLSRARAHDVAFKTTLVDLAGKHHGERWFDGARAVLGHSYRVVDNWVASGIRAALKHGEAPVARVADDGQLAKILMRIKKLRDLGADQIGLPEGIAATAAANDLITTYGLEGYGVRIDGDVHDQLVDLWVSLEEGALWRRTLAHAVATYCDVFSLAVGRSHRMHFFGRHADVVTAEYLFSVSAGRITRECAEHIAPWKRGRSATSAGDTRSEKTSFCDSAAIAFKKKLDQLKSDDDLLTRPATSPSAGVAGKSSRRPTASAMLEHAESFAADEHEKRGQSWGSGGRRTYRENAAGRALGGAMEVVHGLGGENERPKALPHR